MSSRLIWALISFTCEELSVKRSNRLVILVGVLLAVLAFVGIVVFLNQARHERTADEPTTVTVIVAIADIAIGDPVTPDLAETREVAAEAVEQTRIADPSQLTGTPATVPIAAGEQITREKAGQGTTVDSVEPQLEPGEKAIAFQVDRVTGLDFLHHAGRPHRHRDRPGRDANPADGRLRRGAAEQQRCSCPVRGRHRIRATCARSRRSSRTAASCTSARRGSGRL